MKDIALLVELLCSKDHNAACGSMKQLLEESEISSAVYPYFDQFTEMMNHPNSYVRTRGLLLIAANARWDTDHQIDEIINRYLTHVMDQKPITARQCIQALPEIAKYKPDLIGDIQDALKKADTERYAASMQPLVYRDIRNALKEIQKLG